MDGCCHMDGTEDCCCDITEHSPEICSSAQDSFDFWAVRNGCDKGTTFASLKQDTSWTWTTHTGTSVMKTAQCARATPSGNGCAVITELCLYDSMKHNMHSASEASTSAGADAERFPSELARRVMTTFYETVCVQRGGEWLDRTGAGNVVGYVCHCEAPLSPSSDVMGDGWLCLDSQEVGQVDEEMNAQHGGSGGLHIR